MQWHSKKIKDVFKQVRSDRNGLNKNQAYARLKIFGFNALPRNANKSILQIFARQFHNTLVYILLVIALVSFVIPPYHFVDGFFILIVVLVNNFVSFAQEYKADKTLEELQKAVKVMAFVIRNKREIRVSAEKIVPGDIIVLKPGLQIPADARIIRSIGLTVNESALTGESLPVQKDSSTLPKKTALHAQKNMVWLGTLVYSGYGTAVVVATGVHTRFGSISLVAKKIYEQKTPLQKKISSFSKWLGIAIIGLGAFIFIVGCFIGIDCYAIFYTSVALIVSVIPEGLLPAITVILIVGMRRILQHKGLVRRLSATEALGATDVICFDKTGTLTTGKMSVRDIITNKLQIAWHIMANCNDAFTITNKLAGQPTNQAMFYAAINAGFKQKQNKLGFLPFDAKHKYLAALYADELLISGAPEILLEKSSISKMAKKRWRRQIKRWASRGFRVIGLGYKEIKQDFSKKYEKLNISAFIKSEYNNGFDFIGLVLIEDPLRTDAKQNIELCKYAGLKPVIITGDHVLTARRIAREVGLRAGESNIIEGSVLSKLSDSELEKRIYDINLFSRVTPKQKLRIISVWQNQGKIIAMTGDGINDSLALKKADIGCALGSGTDIAKQSADLILLSNSFSTIIQAIKQGRIVFANIKRLILYLLASDVSEVLLILSSIMFGMPLPLLPAQILWINIAEDILPGFSLAMTKAESGIMSANGKASKHIFTYPIKAMLLFYGILSALGSIILFVLLLHFSGNLPKARTIVLAEEVISSALFVFSCSSMNKHIFQKKILSNKWILFANFISLLFLAFAVYSPIMHWMLRTVSLGITDWLMVAIISLFVIILVELFKKEFVIKHL